jgi:hypothetical protein
MASQHEPLPTDTPYRYFAFTQDEVAALSWVLEAYDLLPEMPDGLVTPGGIDVLPAMRSSIASVRRKLEQR